ncbi:MAG: 50S ribosomal protein L22 [Gammaproteobacteria bacterium]
MAAIRAFSRNAPVSPQKGRLVADQIRGLDAARALETLQFSRRKAGALIKKVLNSALANAEENANADIDTLYVKRIEVSDGITMKRAQFGARGRVSRICKRRSHILIELAEAKKGKN